MSYAADNLVIIGLGLIGGSLARALRHSGFSKRFIGYGHREPSLQRGIEYSIKWSEKTGHPAQDFLRYGNDNAVAFAISTGRISPWLVFNSESGQAYLADMNADQTKIVWPWIDPDFWQKKFRDYPADQAYCEEILKQAGW